MIKSIRHAPLLFFLLMLAPAPALAWGSAGHATVGALADRLLRGSHAQREVAALLLPGENLEQAANWLDCAKGTFCGPLTPEMLDYTLDHPRHAHYHYTDIPFQRAYYRAGGIGSAADDIVHTLGQAIAVLQSQNKIKDDADAVQEPHRFTPRQALLLIAHLVGDIHQPLHVGVAYVDKKGQFVLPARALDVDGVTVFDTRGGNSFVLGEANLIPAHTSSGAGKSARRSLHAYWDVVAVDEAMRRSNAVTPGQFADSLIAGLPPLARGNPGLGGDPANWPVRWATDGLRVAKLAHAGLRPGRHGVQTGRNGESIDVWALTLPPDYPSMAASLARQQLASAGWRLALLLQAIWP
jgi:hypothetical protein